MPSADKKNKNSHWSRKKFVIVLWIIFPTSHFSTAQTFVVSESKKCYSSETKIRSGDTLSLTSVFQIEKGGRIVLRHNNGWLSRHTVPMEYNVGGIFDSIKATREYTTHDSIYNVLKANEIYQCEFPYLLKCKPIFGGVATSLADMIRGKNDIHTETSESSIRIEWTHPGEYTGQYYILVSNLFEDYVDLKVTSTNFIDLNLIPYRSQNAIVYKVISEECRESDQYLVIMK